MNKVYINDTMISSNEYGLFNVYLLKEDNINNKLIYETLETNLTYNEANLVKKYIIMTKELIKNDNVRE